MNPDEEVEILEYEMVTEDEPGPVSRAVTRRLAEGWTVFGNPFFAEVRGRKAFCQAMTRQVRITRANFDAKFGPKGPAASTEILKKAIIDRTVPPKKA